MSRPVAVRSRASELGSVARRRLPALLLVLVAVSSLLLLLGLHTVNQIPVAWPAAGLLTGLLLVTDQHRGVHLALGGLLLVTARLLADPDVISAIGFSAATVAGALVTWNRLRRGLVRRRVGLVEEGDVSRLIAAASQGAMTAATIVVVTVAISPSGGSPWLAGVAVLGTHAASQLILVPLFARGPSFAPLASRRERGVQIVLTLGVTAALFSYAAAPPLVFAVMPMFAWLAFRGTLREASLLLVGVAAIASIATALRLGPVHDLATRYDIAPELVIGFLALFLVDCALLLLPLSVMTTQQRMSAARARAGQQTLQRLVDAATGSAVLYVDLDGVVRVFNPGAEAVFVRGSDEVVGSPADLLFADAELLRQAARMGTAPIFAEICAAAVVAGDERQPWHFQRPDGELRSMLLTLTSVSDEHGEAAGYLCVGEDVTEREAVHKALVEAVERLTELERVKADFVATVSHELRTPLTSMIGYLELLDDGEVGDLTSAQRTLTDRVQRNSRRLLLLVEDLLLLSQIEDRQLTMQPRSLDLRAHVTASLESMSTILGGRDLEVVSRLPQVPVTLEGDPDQLERMLVNLLSNAVKFTPDGGRVELVVSETTDSVELTVLDTGMGIPEAEQDQLFTRFFRASSASAQAIQGAGLGLTIVRTVVEAHGGHVTVSSSEGVGTTVSVSLPRTLSVDRSADRPVADQPQSATPYNRSPASPSPGTM
ncbi:hypothetical protein GCM10009623_21500 [Nocardioides aestuarii]|uniref:histidine kinase n=1 Tax=Nocardioides aestuarii TaxID=252231 RepID=A0ABW4TP73_9ACTN